MEIWTIFQENMLIKLSWLLFNIIKNIKFISGYLTNNWADTIHLCSPQLSPIYISCILTGFN